MRPTPSLRASVPAAPDARAVALRTAWIDRSARQVIGALKDAGIESLLLKGSTTARWLYEPDEVRGYVDIDLLVDAAAAPAVDRVLLGLGYSYPLAGASPDEEDDHSWTYRPVSRGHRPVGSRCLDAEIDVHFTLAGVRGPAAGVWEELHKRSVDFPLSGGVVAAVDEVGRSVVVVLHAARDAGRKEQSLEDLRRLARRLPEEDWPRAAALARRFDATEAFAAGLLLLEDGPVRLARLGIPQPASVQALLNRRDVPTTALRVERIAMAPDLRSRAGLVARELWPTTVWLRYWAGEQGWNSAGLVELRARRVARVVSGTPPAVAAWLRVRAGLRRAAAPTVTAGPGAGGETD